MSTVSKAVLIALTVVAVVVALGTAWIDQGKITLLRKQVATQQQSDSSRESALTRRLSELSSQVDNLNQPQDPLSAYTEICNQDFTNNNTGLSQTYYFPCTNSATTIPQPGN